jgi:hypothetical protein
MGGPSLIYSFVAKGTIVLAEYTTYSGNFSTIAIQCLHKLPTNNNKFTYSCDHHTFNYLVEDGISMYSYHRFCFFKLFISDFLAKCYVSFLPSRNWCDVMAILITIRIWKT